MTHKIITALLGLLIASAATSETALLETDSHSGSVVLIIDDLGNNLDQGLRAINLPGTINCAILPHTPNAGALAEHAVIKGHEVLVHAPMSNMSHKPLGPGGLTEHMDKHQFLSTVRAALDAVPHARGLSNHMGSQLTQLQQPMDWLMQELLAQGYYFVDSRTTASSLAHKTAETLAVPHIGRDIFLDHDRNPAQIARQFEKLLRIAKHRGQAVAIGHPYPETLNFLEQTLPQLEQQGFQLIRLSEAIATNEAAEHTGIENIAALQRPELSTLERANYKPAIAIDE